jgi:large subunit ribosomal protein L30
MATLKLKLTRSVIGSKPKQRATIKSLGFSKTNQVIERVNTPEIRGMVAKVSHWVEVVEAGN